MSEPATTSDRLSLDHLLPQPVSETVESLRLRIDARFPGRGLGRVAVKLQYIVDAVGAGREAHRRQAQRLRIAATVLLGLFVAGGVVAIALALHGALRGNGPAGLDWLPLLDSAINDVVFAAVAVVFLVTLPDRVQRRGLLRRLYELRSLAHVVDMHQLSKDPERLRPDFPVTAATRPFDLDRDQLERYLEYCSELLSLISKTASLCAEETADPVVLQTVSTVEDLVSGLTRKIWQKISRLPPPTI